MSRKIDLQLLGSWKMSSQNEHSIVRFPRRARENFGFSQSTVVVGKGRERFGLRIKKAHRSDVQKLACMINKGEISEKDAKYVGFVSRATFNRINKGAGQNIWVSEGVEDITIGADPEFGFIVPHTGRLKRGDEVLPHAGKLGSDGPGVEVRPSPSQRHLEVVKDITRILNRAPSKAQEYLWKGGATYRDNARTYWFGGHIHLGRPGPLNLNMAQRCYQKIALLLDSFLALPMVRFDTPNPHLRRNGCKYGYGKAGRFNTSSAAASIRFEDDRFEYRVLSGLWLTHPDLAKIVLGAAKCIAESAYNRMADKGFDYEWILASPSQGDSLLKSFGVRKPTEIHSLINQSQRDHIKPEQIKLWRDSLRELDRFQDYTEEMEALIALTQASPRTIVGGLDLDIKKNWSENPRLLPNVTTARLREAIEAVEDKK